MNRLIELANKIKDKDLREKTVKVLKEPQISNSEMGYQKSELEKTPAWLNGHHFYEGGLVDHTVSVTEGCISMAKVFEKNYSISINYDHLIAGALLHDIMKVFILSKVRNQWSFSGCKIDHATLAAAELYVRKFPEDVIHIVASHGGDAGAAAANPKTIEAIILFYVDMFDAAIESFIHPREENYNVLFISKE